MKRRTGAIGLTARALAVAVGLALVAASASGDESRTLPIAQLEAFGEIFDLVKEQYVRPVDDRKLLVDAIRGMVSGLDPHSDYLTAEDHEELQEGTSGEFGGLGIEITAEDGIIRIITPLDGSPAYDAGLLPGDLVTRVDGESVRDMTATEAAKRIRGLPGTPVTLTILREGEEGPIEFTIVRDIVEVASVKSELLDPGFAHIRISRFQTHTGVRLAEEIRRMEEANDGPLSGAVLDLRNNPGGILSGAVAVADAFLDDGLIVYTQGREPSSREEYYAKPSDLLRGVPIVALVNGGSASRGRDRRRSPPGSTPGGSRRHPDVRKGLGPDHPHPERRLGPEADDLPVLHPVGPLDPGPWHHSRHRAPPSPDRGGDWQSLDARGQSPGTSRRRRQRGERDARGDGRVTCGGRLPALPGDQSSEGSRAAATAPLSA